jgi:hypothetical protein
MMGFWWMRRFCLAKLKFLILSIQIVKGTFVATCVIGHVDVMIQMTCLQFIMMCPLLNPLTPELNPSAQRCLTRFFIGDFAS